MSGPSVPTVRLISRTRFCAARWPAHVAAPLDNEEVSVSRTSGHSRNDVVVGGGAGRGWWLVDDEGGPCRIVAGPFPDRIQADWAADPFEHDGGPRPQAVFGLRRADGGLDCGPSPEDDAWWSHLAEQLERLPLGWDGALPEDDPLITLAVDVMAALTEIGLPVLDCNALEEGAGGACVTPEPRLDGIIVSWRQQHRMSVEQVHGAEATAAVGRVMNGALASALALRGFVVEPFDGVGGNVVRLRA